MLSSRSFTSLSTKRLFTLERAGRFDEALESFSDGWEDDAYLPDASMYQNAEYPEILVRFGSLIGFYGFKHGIEGSQERSRDILTQAREYFVDPADAEKLAETENYIALSYWRSGEFREALAWIEEAFSRDLPASSQARLYSEVIRSILFLATGRIEENIHNCLAIEATMRQYGDAFLNGCLCTNVALSYKRLARNRYALRYLGLAREFHQRSRHQAYLGTVHNNLAQLLRAEGSFLSAHESVDAAIRIYRKIKDRTREGSSLDTKAQIYLAEQKLGNALKVIDRSIKLLKTIPGSSDLAESFLTKAKILLRSDNFVEAVLSLVEAVNITRVQNGDPAAEILVREFEAAVKEVSETRSSVPASSPVDTDQLELVIPPSLAGAADYKGIWIRSDKLDNAGIPSGSLAIVSQGRVARGDLAAVLDHSTGVVSCGYFDSEFGIICLETEGNEPELFDDAAVTVLGKIVGVCKNGRSHDGRMIVEPLPLAK